MAAQADTSEFDARLRSVIGARPIGISRRVAEVWQYRGLLRFFGWQFVRKFYANTWLGWTWIPLRVLLGLGARGLVFGTFLQTPSGDVPYMVFFACGLAFWELFAWTWYFGTRSLELSRRFIKRIYVPRLAVLLASLAPGMLWCFVYLVVFGLTLGAYGIADHTLHLALDADTWLALAGVVLIAMLALALSLWTSVFGALGVRDPRFVVRQVLHVWFYLTPVIYPLSLVPDGLQGVMALNPLTAPMEMIHRGLLGDGTIQTSAVIITLSTIAIVGIAGLKFFDASETRALDRL